MNCYLHPDVTATAYCRACGRPMCPACQFPAEGTVFCIEHAPQTATAGAAAKGNTAGSNPFGGAGAANPYTASANPYGSSSGAYTSSSGTYAGGADAGSFAGAAPPPPQSPTASGLQTSPGLAFLLGLIPGVGAIYNGQYAKGLTHAVIFGLLISLSQAAENTGGQPVLVMCCIAFFCYMPMEAYHTAKKRQLGLRVDEWSGLLTARRSGHSLPLGPVAIIVAGIIFLLQSLNVLNFRFLVRFWPVVLIGAGLFMLFARLRFIRREETETSAAELLEPSREH